MRMPLFAFALAASSALAADLKPLLAQPATKGSSGLGIAGAKDGTAEIDNVVAKKKKAAK
jgi:hypothetical protein